ncbi:proteasome assembly chaperone family protein [Candidatus Bathyarchaeota archaeon]|nr:proteasome assembly chaperone family protein [Candidatus Bathyarchaeota archaeon]
METMIVEGAAKPNRPVIVEGLPGLGSVGRIVTREIIRSLKAKRIATLYSPLFPYYALVDSRGVVRLPWNEFYYWRSMRPGREIVVITGDCQPQTSAGQYEVADTIMEYAEKYSSRLIITVGGYTAQVEDEAKVIGAATDRDTVKRLTELGVIVDKSGIPVVGVSGLILGLAQFRGLPAACLLGETSGYVPDPKAAKSVLRVLVKLLGIKLDLAGIDRDIARMAEVESRIRKAERDMDLALRGRIAEKTVSYIS